MWVVLIAVTSMIGSSLYVDVFHAYIIRNDNGGTILWNSKEAYLFMTVHSRGYRLTWPGYVAALVLQWFNSPTMPTDQKVVFTVIHVTASEVEQHVADFHDPEAIPPHFFTPVGASIYAFSGGTIYKLNGLRFDPASPEEIKAIGGLEHLSSDISVDSLNGWSERGIGTVSRDHQFSVTIGTERALRIVQGNIYKTVTDSPTVLLERSGHPPTVLWHVDGDPHMAGKFIYQRVFSAKEPTTTSSSPVSH